MSSSSSTSEVVADAGPIIALARLDLLALPGSIFERVLVTDTVIDECMVVPGHAENDSIRLALDIGQLHCVDWSVEQEPSTWNLDRGEASTLSLAAHTRARVLVDDLAARRVAQAIGISVVGTCGLLLVARRRGLVEAVRPLVEHLAESGYYLSRPLIEAVCRLAGEP